MDAQSSAWRARAADLGSPDWNKRNAATEQLAGIGSASYPVLKEHFKTTRSYETRRRIRTIVERNELFRTTDDRGGFLGIQPQPVDSATDPVVPRGETWIKVTLVVESSAAQRAGMRNGDYITSLNGTPVKDLAINALGITPWIRSNAPGTVVVMELMRGGRPLVLTATLGRRAPNQMYASSIAASNKRQDAMTRFSQWWRKEFDPDGLVDEAGPTSSDPRWTLESPHAGAASP